MAMVKPIALTKNAFDATNNEVFSFTSSGGNQIVKNKITIRKNSDNTIVYTNILETFAFNQTVPANTLTNGEYYNYFFNTYDISNNESPASNIVPFYCYTQPTLTFTNISNNDTIESSNYQFIVEYDQIQDELLDNLKFILYDINGNILSESETLYSTDIPPFQMNHTFEGMGNNSSYQIQVIGSTVNGTQISSSKITFEVRFENPAVYTKIDLENKCNDGYVQFRSNLVFIDGVSNPDPPFYIGTESVDLGEIGYWVEWNQGYNIPSNFILELWLTPALLGEFCKMWNVSSLSEYVQLNLLRNRLNGEMTLKDTFEVYAIGENGYVTTYSNRVDILNNLSKIVVWVKKINDTWSLNLDVLERTDNVLMWNPDTQAESNVEFNKITNLYWQDETFDETILTNHIDNVDDIFPITNTKISNGIYDHIDITKDTSLSYSAIIPDWTYYTILDCDFNNNINGGNTNILLSQLEGLKIKRREVGTFNWIALKDIVVNSVEDLNIVYQDSYIPSFHTFQWALVPILNGAIEAEYIINQTETSFNGVFISNKNRIFKLYNSVGYGGTTRVKNVGIIQTIGNKYPTFINNSVVDYEQGEITATLYGYEFETTRLIDPVSVVEQTNDLLEFLNDGTAKIITDWNGNIKLVRINPSPTVAYNQTYGNRITTVTFQWTEQGAYNNQEDLYYNELLDVLS